MFFFYFFFAGYNHTIKKIEGFLDGDSKHISVGFPDNSDYNVAFIKSLDSMINEDNDNNDENKNHEEEDNKKVLYVVDDRYGNEIKQITKSDICNYKEIDDIDINKYQIIFLYRLAMEGREKVTLAIEKHNCKTISFYYRKKADVNDIKLFITDEVIDIRDFYQLKKEKQQAIINELKKENEELRLNEEKNKEELKKIEEQLIITKDENGELRKKEEELKEKIEKQNRQIEDCEKLASELSGVSLEKIEEMVAKMGEIYDECFNDIDENNEEQLENAKQKYQDKLSDFLKNECMESINEEREKAYCELFENKLSDVWNSFLDENSKKYLVSAKYTYDNLNSKGSDNWADYSGVCLLACKTIESEIAQHCVENYKTFLQNKYTNPSDWPNTMKKDRTNPIELKGKNDFMMGQFSHLLGHTFGVERRGDFRRRINQDDFDKFFEYAKEELYNLTDEEDISNKLRDTCVCMTKTTKRFRNPSCHKERVNRTTAENCLNKLLFNDIWFKTIFDDMK